MHAVKIIIDRYFPLKYSNLPLLSNPASYLPFIHFPPSPQLM